MASAEVSVVSPTRKGLNFQVLLLLLLLLFNLAEQQKASSTLFSTQELLPNSSSWQMMTNQDQIPASTSEFNVEKHEVPNGPNPDSNR
ncbi:hypothetical protein IEQ34_012053 [Dendrobium chrysotoxum]|uniref:Uncharacterized protein n=1 Tax=Dendrobium chrysotoxum TaxID=161865 RepID=A0AAV7GBU2_DENCH|nr:hypothetical protein IEQ34_012053 [Dendrobium chrysotoxum]